MLHAAAFDGPATSAQAAGERIAQAFAQIHTTRMQGLPFVNEALRVEAVGFRAWEGRWLGVLITPWFMNLVLLPDDAERWVHVRFGEYLAYTLPAGVFDFLSAHEPLLGEYHSCSLFSPMFEFGDQDGARLTAEAAVAALFDPATRAGAEGPGTAMSRAEEAEPSAPAAPQASAPAKAPVSKRDFLRGRWTAAGSENESAQG